MHLTSLLSAISALSTLSSLVSGAPLSESELHRRGPLVHKGVRMVSNKSSRCLSPIYQSRYPNNGDPVGLMDCQWSKLWDIYQDGSVVMHDFNGFAIDAGSKPGNGVRLKVWTSYPGAYQQTWTMTSPDRRINKFNIKGSNLCMDEGDTGMQTWQCYIGNPNQVFRIEYPPIPV